MKIHPTVKIFPIIHPTVSKVMMAMVVVVV